MIGLIEHNRTSLEKLCARYRVERLELFGSAATDEFDPGTSDLDFLVEFQRSDDMSLADQYFGLLADLEELFGHEVDLVMSRALRNRYFIEAVNRTRRLVYACQVGTVEEAPL